MKCSRLRKFMASNPYSSRKDQMTIGKKICFAFAALFTMMIALGTISTLNLNRVDSAVHSIAVDSLPGLYSSARLDSLVREMRVVMLRHIAVDNAEMKYQAESSI